jgi:hypothetical protein
MEVLYVGDNNMRQRKEHTPMKRAHKFKQQGWDAAVP